MQLMSIVAQGGKLISRNTTLETIYEVREAATTGLLCKNGMSEQALSIIGLAIVELSALADTIFTNETCSDTAIMIANEYPHHRPQEVIVAIKNGLAGKYGKTYGKVTTMEVMRWVKEYDETDRVDFFERKSTEKPKGDWKDIDTSLFSQIITSPDKPKVEQKVEQSDNNKWAQQVMRDFDKEAKIVGSMSFIQVPDCLDGEGNMVHMTLDEYLQYRVKKDFKE